MKLNCIKNIRHTLINNNKLNAISEVLLVALHDAITTYNDANSDLKRNGYIVESYKQKYVNPSYKIRTQSLKDINKILSYFSVELKEDYDDEEVGNFIDSLIN